MKGFTAIVLLMLLSHSAFSQNGGTKSFDFAVQQVEDNYAGFPSKVVQSTKEDYEKLKEQLRGQIKLKSRSSNDAIGQYIAWFDDFHLCYGQYSMQYMPRNYKFYNEIDYAPQSIHTKVDNQTYLIRISSFDACPSRSWVDQSIKEYSESGCENLIVDIRGNGGGSDHYVEPYVELLYDKPGFIYGVEVRNTKKYQSEIKKLSLKEKFLRDVYTRMIGSNDQFVTLVASDTVRYDKVAQFPRKAAVIIDRYVASSGEGFIVQLRALSSRTTIYGSEKTLGCYDFSNCTQVSIPGSGTVLEIPMTRSLGLADGQSVDRDGIRANVKIDLPLPHQLTDNIDEWVLWVADDLKKQK